MRCGHKEVTGPTSTSMQIAHIHLKYLWDLHPLAYPPRPWSPSNANAIAILPPFIFPLQIKSSALHAKRQQKALGSAGQPERSPSSSCFYGRGCPPPFSESGRRVSQWNSVVDSVNITTRCIWGPSFHISQLLYNQVWSQASPMACGRR